jgi:hypothetical protein
VKDTNGSPDGGGFALTDITPSERVDWGAQLAIRSRFVQAAPAEIGHDRREPGRFDGLRNVHLVAGDKGSLGVFAARLRVTFAQQPTNGGWRCSTQRRGRASVLRWPLSATSSLGPGFVCASVPSRSTCAKSLRPTQRSLGRRFLRNHADETWAYEWRIRARGLPHGSRPGIGTGCLPPLQVSPWRSAT